MSVPQTDLRAVKRQLSPRVLAIPGVSGLGLPGGALTVYLEEDSEEVRRKVANVIRELSPDARFFCVVSGAFHPR